MPQTESYGVDPKAETVIGGARPEFKPEATCRRCGAVKDTSADWVPLPTCPNGCEPTKYHVFINFMGKRMKGGVVVWQETAHGDGWQFFPATQESPSRKLWPTPSAAVKRRWPKAELVAA